MKDSEKGLVITAVYVATIVALGVLLDKCFIGIVAVIIFGGLLAAAHKYRVT